MKSSPRKPTGKPTGRPSNGAKRPSFGKSFSKPSGGRKTEGSADKRPRRFDRAGEGASSGEERKPTSRPTSRFSKKPAFGNRDEERTTSRSSGRDADKRPRRFDRAEEAAPRGETRKPSSRPTSRFAKKPAFGTRDDARRPSTTDKRPRRAPPREAATPTLSAAAPRSFEKRRPTMQPKRESLQRQGVLLWGLHAVREAWLNPKRKCYRLWTTEAGQVSIKEALDEATAKNLTRPSPLHAEKADIEHFLPHGSVHQGVALEVDPLPEMSLDDLLGQENAPELVIILDQVTDPHNVGAILRSAAAFGAGAVIVTERNAPSATGIMAKTASGAAEHVPLISVINIARTIDALKAENFWCVGLAEEGEKDLCESKLSDGRVALIMGAEGEGLRRLTRERCDDLARLPTGGRIGSLNVSNATAIALYEVKRQRG